MIIIMVSFILNFFRFLFIKKKLEKVIIVVMIVVNIVGSIFIVLCNVVFIGGIFCLNFW